MEIIPDGRQEHLKIYEDNARQRKSWVFTRDQMEKARVAREEYFKRLELQDKMYAKTYSLVLHSLSVLGFHFY